MEKCYLLGHSSFLFALTFILNLFFFFFFLLKSLIMLSLHGGAVPTSTVPTAWGSPTKMHSKNCRSLTGVLKFGALDVLKGRTPPPGSG